MALISLADMEQTVRETARYNHSHLQGATRNDFNRVILSFKPFTGMEEEPTQPSESRRDGSLSDNARKLLSEQYEEANSLWREARYVRDLKDAIQGASTVWALYLTARTRMEDLYAALGKTPDSHWRSTVSNLVAAQRALEEAAKKWDERAARIAAVHGQHLSSDLSRATAYERAGAVVTGWVIGSVSDYDYPVPNGTPLVKKVTEIITAQRDHLQQVAALTGDRSLL
ncbi:hypothetical protein ACWCQP_45065 [Streptomyces chartreusis]